MKRSIVVFGATGEIGGRIASLAAKAGHQVVGVCRRQRETGLDMTGVEFAYGDKYDDEFLGNLAKRKFDAIIDTIPNDRLVARYQKFFPDVENVLFCSSTGAFVPLQYFPADENHPWREDTGVNFIGQSEWDIVALDAWQEKKFPVSILRPTNIIGETRVPLELWGGRNPLFYQKLKKNEPVIIPHCDHILVQSGYNWDLASAFVKALDYPDRIRGEIFIISCKHAITLGRFLQTAMDYLHSKSEIIRVSPEDVCRIMPDVRWHYGMDFLMEHMCFDISKAQNTFGYDPQVSTEEGLVRSLKWMEENGKL